MLNSEIIYFHIMWTEQRIMAAFKTEILPHYENKPKQIYWKFYHQKMKIFR